MCTFCGSQEHVYLNCVLYRENLKNQKQGISNQNEEKYKMVAVSRGGATQTQQGRVHTSKKEGSKTGTQEHTIKSGSPRGIISAGGGGDKPPRRPHNTKKEPDTKVTDELEEEEEDSDRTETVSMSSVPSDYKVVSKDGIEMSLQRFLKARGRRRKRHRHKGGNGGGDGSSSSSSDNDLGNNSDEFQIEIIRGKWGHRGQSGRKGPQGPLGPVITLPPPVQHPIYKPPDPNITLNSTGMEESFKGLRESLNKIFNQQVNLNETSQGHVTLGVWAQGEQAQALRLLAESSQQQDYDRLFSAIPMYNGEDPTACKEWLEKLETACRTGRRDIRDVAITCVEGPVPEVINSMQEDEEWPVLRDEIRRCFSDNKTPVHAAVLLEDFPAQGPNQNLRAFLYKYMKLHKMATNIQARHDYDLRQKLHFLKRLRNTRIANKIGRSAEFKDYNNFSLAMCFGQALEMEGEFQVGEKCVPREDPQIMVVDVARMSDAEICYLMRGHTPVTPTPPMGIQTKFNPNPCFQCGFPGHKATNCLHVQKDKVPEIGGKIHHFMETYTPVDKELW